MGRSNRLRASDVRAALRLVGDCRDLRHDPADWHAHATEGLRPLVGADTVCGLLQPPGGYRGLAGIWQVLHAGLTPAAMRLYHQYWTSGAHLTETDHIAYMALVRGRPNVTARRRRLIRDEEWYATPQYNEYRKRADTDQYLITDATGPAAPASTSFFVMRAVGRPAFTAGEAKRVHLFHQELARLVGGPLAAGPADPLAGVSPRGRQVLACLREGDSVKQVAARLGISRHTVQDHVKALHRRFEVSSRAELFAALDRRRGGRPSV